ncbi:hypothetical protein HPB50_022388 [Hyalomma asiaticum]|uniref:Uncharacterized protein n=1 Tax=Hyalomma asiaticum TaxID=266040 RepID=A0ACB7S245_HYAAI|nr:hypothetical protein HPB50_022388 [Hyalomma asiaticum]
MQSGTDAKRLSRFPIKTTVGRVKATGAARGGGHYNFAVLADTSGAFLGPACRRPPPRPGHRDADETTDTRATQFGRADTSRRNREERVLSTSAARASRKAEPTDAATQSYAAQKSSPWISSKRRRRVKLEARAAFFGGGGGLSSHRGDNPGDIQESWAPFVFSAPVPGTRKAEDFFLVPAVRHSSRYPINGSTASAAPPAK